MFNLNINQISNTVINGFKAVKSCCFFKIIKAAFVNVFAIFFAGLLLLIIGFVSSSSFGQLSEKTQTDFFISFLLISGSIFTSIIFADLGNKKKAIPVLTLPSSHFEKYLANWLYTFLIFQIFFVAVFYLILAIVINLWPHTFTGLRNTYLNVFSTEKQAYVAFIIYPFLHAVVFLGAIHFEKLHFIKTAFTLFIGVFLLEIINQLILSAMIDRTIIGTSIFSPIHIRNEYQYVTIKAYSIKNYEEGIVLGLVIMILWICAYFRLKEKEV